MAGSWRVFTLLCLAGAACSRGVRPPCENAPPFYVTLRASDRLNPDGQGHSLTTMIRVLQLKGTTRLEGLDFADVWQRGKETLGEDLLQSNDTSIDPGNTMTFGFPRDPKAAYAVVMGIFRLPSSRSWRSVVRLPDVPADQCTAQPAEVKSKPSKEDTQFGFVVQDFRVEGGKPDASSEPDGGDNHSSNTGPQARAGQGRSW